MMYFTKFILEKKWDKQKDSISPLGSMNSYTINVTMGLASV